MRRRTRWERLVNVNMAGAANWHRCIVILPIETCNKTKVERITMINYSELQTVSRDTDFMKACRRVIAESRGDGLTAADVATQAALMEAPGYYVGFDYARRMVRRIRRSGSMPWNGEGVGRRWVEIVARMDGLKARYGIDDGDALARVLGEGRASSFFIQPASALRLYYRIRRRHRCGGKSGYLETVER